MTKHQQSSAFSLEHCYCVRKFVAQKRRITLILMKKTKQIVAQYMRWCGNKMRGTYQFFPFLWQTSRNN